MPRFPSKYQPSLMPVHQWIKLQVHEEQHHRSPYVCVYRMQHGLALRCECLPSVETPWGRHGKSQMLRVRAEAGGLIVMSMRCGSVGMKLV